jgi:hypothetical protein
VTAYEEFSPKPMDLMVRMGVFKKKTLLLLLYASIESDGISIHLGF